MRQCAHCDVHNGVINTAGFITPKKIVIASSVEGAAPKKEAPQENLFSIIEQVKKDNNTIIEDSKSEISDENVFDIDKLKEQLQSINEDSNQNTFANDTIDAVLSEAHKANQQYEKDTKAVENTSIPQEIADKVKQYTIKDEFSEESYRRAILSEEQQQTIRQAIYFQTTR